MFKDLDNRVLLGLIGLTVGVVILLYWQGERKR